MDSVKNADLKIKTFGGTDILYRDKSILYEKQLTPRLRSLLQYFIINRNKWCMPATIIDELWRDSDFVDEKKVLRTYVYRLRSVLAKDNEPKKDFSGQINILSSNGNYQMSVTDDVEIDTDIFQRLTDYATSLHTYREILNMADMLRNVYTGHFMSDSSDDNIIGRLQNNYLSIYCVVMRDILTKLTYLEQYDDVINICEAFFQTEDLDDTINCIYIKTLIEKGRTNDASRHYNFVAKKLREVLQVEPSSEMSLLYKNIRISDGEDTLEGALTSLNTNHIKSIVEAIVLEKMEAKGSGYSILKLEILNKSNKKTVENANELLKSVMVSSLRRRDVYAVLDEHTAVAILHEANENSYELIKNRVSEAFYKIYPKKDEKILVNISPAVNIT